MAKLYCVWKNKPDNDQIVAAYATSQECARAMGVTMSSFYGIVTKQKTMPTAWTIMTIEELEKEEETKQ